MNKSNDFHNSSDPCKHNHVAVTDNMILIMIGSSQDLSNGVQGGQTTIYLLLWTRSPVVDYSRITPDAGMVM